MTPHLTHRRADKEHESWHIYYGDVRVGVVSRRSGNPVRTDPWLWSCGFYPGGRPGADRDGTAADFPAARDAFKAAWRDYFPQHTEADFQEYRDWMASQAEIQAIRARGEKLPSEVPSSMMRCVCGVDFDTHKPAESYPHRVHISAAEADGSIREKQR